MNATGTFQLDPTALPNGLTLVFRSIRADAGPGGDDLYSAVRGDAGADFAQVTPIASLDSTSNEVQPFVTADGSEVYFASDRTGNYDIYRATIQGGVYGAATPVAELNQAGSRRRRSCPFGGPIDGVLCIDEARRPRRKRYLDGFAHEHDGGIRRRDECARAQFDRAG